MSVPTLPDQALQAETYAEFKKELLASNCRKCALHQGRHHLVVDRGNPEAKVMFIGEAPGANEDLEGKAFVGRAGKLLDALFKEIGFDTNQDALIANVVKSRPPGNRPPKQGEVDACLPYLKKQIELVRPKIILLFGATSVRHILGGKKIPPMKEMIGKILTLEAYPGVKFMVLYHPAYLLRDPRKKPEMMEHIREFEKTLGILR